MTSFEKYTRKADTYIKLGANLCFLAYNEIRDGEELLQIFKDFSRTNCPITRFSTEEMNRLAEKAARAYAELEDHHRKILDEDLEFHKNNKT